MLQDRSFELNDHDEERLRQGIGVYLNYFTKDITDENVVFSVPYNDTGGLGMYACYTCRIANENVIDVLNQKGLNRARSDFETEPAQTTPELPFPRPGASRGRDGPKWQ